MKYALAELNKIVEPPEDISDWVAQCQKWKEDDPFHYNENFAGILPQHAIRELWQLTQRPRSGHHRRRRPAPDVGRPVLQVQPAADVALSSAAWARWASACPRRWAPRRPIPTSSCIDIDGDGSFLMNIQELATCFCEKLPVKVLLLNNQHLGMVVQWEDRFMQGNRAHTYLGPIDHPEAVGQGDGLGPKRALSRLRARSPRASAAARPTSATRPTWCRRSKR